MHARLRAEQPWLAVVRTREEADRVAAALAFRLGLDAGVEASLDEPVARTVDEIVARLGRPPPEPKVMLRAPATVGQKPSNTHGQAIVDSGADLDETLLDPEPTRPGRPGLSAALAETDASIEAWRRDPTPPDTGADADASVSLEFTPRAAASAETTAPPDRAPDPLLDLAGIDLDAPVIGEASLAGLGDLPPVNAAALDGSAADDDPFDAAPPPAARTPMVSGADASPAVPSPAAGGLAIPEETPLELGIPARRPPTAPPDAGSEPTSEASADPAASARANTDATVAATPARPPGVRPHSIEPPPIEPRTLAIAGLVVVLGLAAFALWPRSITPGDVLDLPGGVVLDVPAGWHATTTSASLSLEFGTIDLGGGCAQDGEASQCLLGGADRFPEGDLPVGRRCADLEPIAAAALLEIAPKAKLPDLECDDQVAPGQVVVRWLGESGNQQIGVKVETTEHDGVTMVAVSAYVADLDARWRVGRGLLLDSVTPQGL